MNQTATKVLTAHMPFQLVEKIDQIAERMERSRAWIMKQALVAWIEQQENRERLTQEAMADVDNNLLIAHQDVQAWADSLSSSKPLAVPR